jgi:ribosomal-protein-alanine N-acetyltransferase
VFLLIPETQRHIDHIEEFNLLSIMQLQFTPFPILSTEHLILRQLSMEDEKEIYFIRTDPSLNKYVNKPETKSIEDVRQFIDKINNGIAKNECLYWVICLKHNGQMCGTICLWNIDKEKRQAETGYTLLPQFQGKGIMREALDAVTNFGFNQMKLLIIEAYTHKDNANSFKLLERGGYIRSDKSAPSEEDLIIYYRRNPTPSSS